jgi:KipI family sensor histidine kinase inhibitor
MHRVVPYGRAGTLVDLECERAPDRALRTHAVASALRAAFPDADIVVGAGTVAVFGGSPEDVRGALAHVAVAAPASGRSHQIATVYDGPDLNEVARVLGITTDDVVARHTSYEYLVELLGFLPGFAYLAAPDFDLVVPRRPSPRTRVPAGSVGVAASFTGVYPFASPGGWNLLGRAVDAAPFDPARDPPVLFAPGDRVRFTPACVPEPCASLQETASASLRGLMIVAAPVCATVQDLGRAGQLGRGLPPSGPLDGDRFLAANTAVGNPASAAAIEIALGSLEVEALGVRATVSVDGERAVTLREGERLRVGETGSAVRYLAVRGGVDVPVVLGARATLIVARLGGRLGRALRRGDVLAIGDAEAQGPSPAAALRGLRDDPLRIDPGPHLDRFPAGAYEALLRATWIVSAKSDRVGVRLEGAHIPRDAPDLALPVPMIRGAVEVTTDGKPIVLGPDHPTTGGYPVLAVLRPSSWATLGARRPGAAVRFSDGDRWGARSSRPS